jgi:hypothetical protein
MEPVELQKMNGKYSNVKYVVLAIFLTIFSIYTTNLNTLTSFMKISISLTGIITLLFAMGMELKRTMKVDDGV